MVSNASASQPFEKKIKDKIGIIQNNSQSNKGVVITLALNYGGRLDIISAINEILIHNKNTCYIIIT